MTVILCNKRTQKKASFSLFKEESPKPNTYENKKTLMELWDYSIKKFSTRKFHLIKGHIDSPKEKKITIKAEKAHCICLILQLNGEMKLEISQEKKTKEYFALKKNECNIFCHKTGICNINITNKKPCDFFAIFLSHAYFEKILNDYPNTFFFLMQLYKKACSTLLFRDNLALPHHLHNLLIELNNYKSFHNVPPLFLEAKILEIFSLIFKDICSSCLATPLSPVQNKFKERLVCAQKIINDYFYEPITIQYLCKKVALNECYLKTGFKKMFHMTIRQYLLHIRLQNAEKYMADTNKTIAEVADIVGYSHHSTFTRAFKKKHGMPPESYRSKFFK